MSLPLAALGVACTDPQARFDDFETRVTDGAVVAMFDAPRLEELPDISGEFFVTFDPVPFAQGSYFQFIWTTELTMNKDGTGTMTLSSLALDVTTRQVAKNEDGTTPDPIVLDIPVNAAGEFRVDFNRAIIPGDANPITGAEVDLDMFGASRIRTEDLYCGTALEGSKTYAPLVTSLVGSVFAARRITPGTIGDALPTPSIDCTVADLVDAGLPDDAGPADAGSPDAALPDAGLPDAAPMIDGSPR